MLYSLSILSSALKANQKAIDIRNRNIANADNPDYVKENPVLQNIYGGGVVVADVNRAADNVLLQQKNNSLTKYKGYDEEYSILSSVATYFDDVNGTGLKSYIDNYFKAVLDFLQNPTLDGSKETLLAYAQSLIDAMKNRYTALQGVQNQMVGNIEKTVETINTLGQQLAEVNKQILLLANESKTDSNDYKFLLDKRDEIISQLAQYVLVEVKTDDIGVATVLIKNNNSTANGYITLVEGSNFNKLDFDSQTMTVSVGGTVWESSDHRFFESGLLGAYFNTYYRMEDYKQELNNLASSLIENSYLSGADSGNGKYIFAGTDLSDISVNITKTDLDTYDTTQGDTDQSYFNQAWDTVGSQYDTFAAKVSNDLTNLKVFRDTEMNLYQSLESKYTAKVGVNTDIELSELLKLQQQYQAISQMIGTSSKLLDYLLNAI
ncbi:MAG: flagellar hook-associated protein FlgK [Aquificota bacterium]|jgi:flagellar hook-associated protein 1 FlgK